jgi:hypothetical protein
MDSNPRLGSLDSLIRLHRMRDICLKVLSWNLHGLAWPLSKDPGGLIQKQLVDLGFVPVCWRGADSNPRDPSGFEGRNSTRVDDPSRFATGSGDNAFRYDWLVERGGFEPPVSREVFPKENTRECWDISRRTRLTASRE